MSHFLIQYTNIVILKNRNNQRQEREGLSRETIAFMERFLSNNQDLQSIDFLNFDSNRIFFRKPKVNKAKSIKLDFDVNLDQIKFDPKTSKLKFTVTLRRTITVNVYFFRKIEKDNEFGIYEFDEDLISNKNKFSKIFKKFGLCFRPDIDKKIILGKKVESEAEEKNIISEINSKEEASDVQEKLNASVQNKQINIFNDGMENEKLQEIKSVDIVPNESSPSKESNLQHNFDYSSKYSKTISPSEDKTNRLLQLTIPPDFFTKLLKFTKSSSYCPFILELVSFSSKEDAPKTNIYVLFEEKNGKLKPLMKLYKNKFNRVFILENIYDLSHEKEDLGFDGSPISLKRDSFEENNQCSGNLLKSGKLLKLKRKKRRVRPYCSICISTRVSTILLPCRHLCVCFDCSKNLVTQTNKCPICRNKITNLVRIYDQ